MSKIGPTPHDAFLGRQYFGELDGLRALAVLLVIACHLYFADLIWMAGFRGVTLFFVLSGYLITTLALREEDRRGRVSLAAFYVRRCCRILPLYYLTLALYGALIGGAGLLREQAKPLGDALPYYLLYFQELSICFRPPLIQDLPFAHSWTLGIEEKFYLLWPLLAFVVWRGAGRFRPRGAAALAVGLGLLSLLLTPLGPVGKEAGKMGFSYASLLAGCLLALLLHDSRWFAQLRRLGGAGWTAAVLAVFLAAHFATPWVKAPWAGVLNLVYTTAVTALLACVLLGDGPLQRLLRWRPLAFVGRLSYGIYLVHILCMATVYKLFPALASAWGGSVPAFFLTCLLSIAVAWGLHIAVELPCIELGRRWSRRIADKAAPGAPAGFPALAGPVHGAGL